MKNLFDSMGLAEARGNSRIRHAFLTAMVLSAAAFVLVCWNGHGAQAAESCSDVATVAAGGYHTVGLKQDGTVVAAGNNGFGQLNVSIWNSVKAVAAGWYHTVGLREDGSLLASGHNGYGQVSILSWTKKRAISAGAYHTVGLNENGTVEAAGFNGYGQLNVSSWGTIRAIATGWYHTVGLKDDGTVVAVGNSTYGQLNVSSWAGIKAVAAGGYHTVGLKEDGTVVAVGLSSYRQTDVSSWRGIKAIAAGTYHTLGLKEDGTVVAVGHNGHGQLNVSSWRDIKAIAAGGYHSVGLKGDGTVVAVGSNGFGQLNVTSPFTEIMPICEPACGPDQDMTPPLTTAVVNGTKGNNGWYVSDVLVTLTAMDSPDGSGAKEIHYSVDGIETIVQGYMATVPVAGDGSHALLWYAIDKAGNVEMPPHEMTINIDRTPPVGSLSASPSVLSPRNHKMVAVLLQGSAVDGGSEIASTVITVNDEYGSYNMTVPDFGSSIALESWCRGTDRNGRVYTITAVTTDKAGNQSTATTTVIVPHDMRK